MSFHTFRARHATVVATRVCREALPALRSLGQVAEGVDPDGAWWVNINIAGHGGIDHLEAFEGDYIVRKGEDVEVVDADAFHRQYEPSRS